MESVFYIESDGERQRELLGVLRRKTCI